MSHLSSVLVSLPKRRGLLQFAGWLWAWSPVWACRAGSGHRCVCVPHLCALSPQGPGALLRGCLVDDRSAEPRRLSQGPVTQEQSVVSDDHDFLKKRVSLATQPHCPASPMYCYYWCNNSYVTGVWIFLCFVLFLHSLQYSPSRMTICSPEWGPCLPDVQPRLVGSWCRVAVMSTSGLIRVPLMVPGQHFSSPLGTFPDAF